MWLVYTLLWSTLVVERDWNKGGRGASSIKDVRDRVNNFLNLGDLERSWPNYLGDVGLPPRIHVKPENKPSKKISFSC
mgnify:CR=1 FL=1